MLRIGKRQFSWNSTRFRMANRLSEKITAINFGEKIERELVRAARRDGTAVAFTSGEYEAQKGKVKFLLDEYISFLQLLTFNGTVGLADIECDMGLQFDEGPTGGVVNIYFPVVSIVGPDWNAAKGTGAQEVELEFWPLEPIQTNGTQLASVVRSITGIAA